MLINKKSIEQWGKEEIETIIHEDTYRENDFIDYKENLPFLLEGLSKEEKDKKKREFCQDICSFANADGGYLFLGISEKEGVPERVIGIEVPDLDKFELSRRNELSRILPVSPIIKFRFIFWEADRYVVVVQIFSGIYKPYVLEENGLYRFFMRKGNQKTPMTYSEIQFMYTHSLRLSDSIKAFREKRVQELINETESREPFLLIQVVPETFQDPDRFIDICGKVENKEIALRYFFENLCSHNLTPNVDGIASLRDWSNPNRFFQVYNSGIIELISYLQIEKRGTTDYLDSRFIQEEMYRVLHSIRKFYAELYGSIKVYVCISIVNCKGICSQDDRLNGRKSFVDRNKIFCVPVSVFDASNESEIENTAHNMEITLEYALGRIWMH